MIKRKGEREKRKGNKEERESCIHNVCIHKKKNRKRSNLKRWRVTTLPRVRSRYPYMQTHPPL